VMVPVVSSPLRTREYSLGILKLARPNPSKDAPTHQSSRNLFIDCKAYIKEFVPDFTFPVSANQESRITTGLPVTRAEP
jgi:hypothetical protein